MTPAEYLARKTMLAEDGVTITGESGTLDYKGVEVAYSYNGADTLTITVEHKPWVIPESEIDNKIRQWFAQPLQGDSPCLS